MQINYQRSEIFVMFYNVENLFQADLNPQRREVHSVSGLRNWNSWRYSNKIFKIGHVFQLAKEQLGGLPVLIGLSEVQGEQPLAELVKSEIFGGRYAYIHYESMDERGVDTALLYDTRAVEILTSEPLTFIFEIEDQNPENYDTTRDVLAVKIKLHDEIVNVFVCHMPSKRQKDINKPRRQFILSKLRERVAELSENGEAVLIMGDFNDNPDDAALVNLLHNNNNGEEYLKNPFLNLYQNKIFSTYHYRDGLLFDQIILSKDFFDERFTVSFQEAGVFRPKEISSWNRKFNGRPFRTYAGTRYLGGYSDHFPVYSKFKLKNI